MFNEMYLLRDVVIGTTTPLIMKVYTDSSKRRNIQPDGWSEITIKKVEMICNNKVIKGNLEKSLFNFFVLYGIGRKNVQQRLRMMRFILSHLFISL